MKMDLAGFSNKVINWFKSYLDRKQCIRREDSVSNIVTVEKGIAQGTVLGPLLFIFYINDILEPSSTSKCHYSLTIV